MRICVGWRIVSSRRRGRIGGVMSIVGVRSRVVRSGFILSMVRRVILDGPSARIVSIPKPLPLYMCSLHLSIRHTALLKLVLSSKTTVLVVQPSRWPTHPAINASPSNPPRLPVLAPPAIVQITHALSTPVPTLGLLSPFNFATRTNVASPRARTMSRTRCRRALATRPCPYSSRLVCFSLQQAALVVVASVLVVLVVLVLGH